MNGAKQEQRLSQILVQIPVTYFPISKTDVQRGRVQTYAEYPKMNRPYSYTDAT
jgi:hypothetical protein